MFMPMWKIENFYAHVGVYFPGLLVPLDVRRRTQCGLSGSLALHECLKLYKWRIFGVLGKAAHCENSTVVTYWVTGSQHGDPFLEWDHIWLVGLTCAWQHVRVTEHLWTKIVYWKTTSSWSKTFEAVHWAMYVPVPAIAKLKSLF